MRPTPRLFVPAITPFHADLTVDLPRLVAFGRRLIAQGADGLAPFGTTSEAASLSVDERMRGLEALASGGIAPDCLIPGTGCAALTDTIRLTGHARALGVRGVLMLPPFYYKPVSTEGLFASYARVIEAVGPGLRVYLYHIPQMTGVPITADLIGRLDLAFPGVVAGLKDSSASRSSINVMCKAASKPSSRSSTAWRQSTGKTLASFSRPPISRNAGKATGLKPSAGWPLGFETSICKTSV